MIQDFKADVICPSCRQELTAVFGNGEQGPRPEDSAMCYHCGAVLVVIKEGLRLATKAELARLSPEIRRVIALNQMRILAKYN